MCTELQIVPHRKWQVLHGYEDVEFRNGHVNHQNTHLSLKERIVFLNKEEPQSPKIPICASGDRLRFIVKSYRHHHATDCTYPAQPVSGRLGIGGQVAFQSPTVREKNTSKSREIHIGERRWYVVGYSGRSSHEPRMIPKEHTKQLRSGPRR